MSAKTNATLGQGILEYALFDDDGYVAVKVKGGITSTNTAVLGMGVMGNAVMGYSSTQDVGSSYGYDKSGNIVRTDDLGNTIIYDTEGNIVSIEDSSSEASAGVAYEVPDGALDPKSFGLSMYERFPHAYRYQDADNRYSLKRYFQAIGDGIEPFIRDLNKFLYFYDPTKVSMAILPKIYSSFGLEMFHGLPEFYVRNLLPMVGQLYKRKGTYDVVEYVASVIADAKVEVESFNLKKNTAMLGDCVLNSAYLSDCTDERPAISITIELQYGTVGEEFPDEEQIKRLIREFVPFYCLVGVIYAFLFVENAGIEARDSLADSLTHETDDGTKQLYVSDDWDRNVLYQDYTETVYFPNRRSIYERDGFLWNGYAEHLYWLSKNCKGILGMQTLGENIFGYGELDKESFIESLGELEEPMLGEGSVGGSLVGYRRPLTTAYFGKDKLGNMLTGFGRLERGELGRGTFGCSVFGTEYLDDWHRDSIYERTESKAEVGVADSYSAHAENVFDMSLSYLHIGVMGYMVFSHLETTGDEVSGTFGFGVFGKSVMDTMGLPIDGNCGIFGISVLGMGQLGRHRRLPETTFVVANDGDSDVLERERESSASTSMVSDGYLPPRSAILGGGQPLGKSSLGVNQPYTSVDYTVDIMTRVGGNGESSSLLDFGRMGAAMMGYKGAEIINMG